MRTPLLRLPLDGEVYVKPESLQRTGSFKFRGAFNALASTPFAAIERGVVADSSGNHAQGVAAAAALHGVPATIVMPENAAPVKVARTAAFGAEIVRCANSSEERQRVAAEIRDTRSLEYIPPFDDARIIAGQGTVGLEIARDLPEVATVVVCVGGGGLISGVSTAVKALCPGARVIGVEPELAADAQESLREGRIVTWPAADVTRTICDGVRTQALGELTFATISALVDEIVTVPEDAVLDAMRWLALEAKLLVEPTAALTLAALQSRRRRASGRADGACGLGRKRRSGAGCRGSRRRAGVASARSVDRQAGAQLRVIAEQPLVEVVELACAGDRGPRTDPLVVGGELFAPERVAVRVALPALEHVEIDVGDRELVTEAPRPARELALEIGAVSIELLAALELDAVVAGGILGEVPRRTRPGGTRRGAYPRATSPSAAERPGRALPAAARARAPAAARRGRAGRPRLVDQLVAVPQCRDASQRIDCRELGRLVAAARMDVDRLVVGARFFERRPRGKAARSRDLEELEHAPTLAISSWCARRQPG